MARTVKEIHSALIAEKNKIPELQGLNSGSQVAIWRLFLYLVATVIHAFEKALDVFKANVYTVIENNRPGTLSWYTEKAIMFQLNDLLDTKTLAYSIIDESRQIIKFASATENISGGVTLKLSKQDAPLSTEELDKFIAYMEQIKFAGTQISYVSIEPDAITIDMEVFYNGLVSESYVRSAIDLAIASYFDDVGFNGVFRLNSLIERLRLLNEVIDVDMRQIEVTQNSQSNLIGISYSAISGRFVYNRSDSVIQLTVL